MIDIGKIQHYFKDRNPFEIEDDLVSISSGIHAHPSVNVEEARENGIEILKEMDGQITSNYTFKRKSQVVTLAAKTIVDKNDTVQIDPNLMFQRLASTVSMSPDNLEKALCFELCSYPPSLFDSSFFMREAQKSQLSDCLINLMGSVVSQLPYYCNYIIDGGLLSQKNLWDRNRTFREIIKKYATFIKTHYRTPLIVFDGY